MKDLFKGYVKKSEEDVEKLWNKATFVFDTNVLLNLYRYSEDTRNSILHLIKNFSSRIYLPHQAAFEFSKNRYEVISDQEKIFNEFSKKLKNIETEINSKLQHPFLSEDLKNEIQNVFKKIEDEVEGNKEIFTSLSKKDPIFDQVCKLFDGKISNKFSDRELEEIYKEGEKRYTKKIPPGFEDISKTENKFGDLILWYQIIEIAKTNPEKGIILISDEKKKDWWWELKDKKIVGPRPELINEIFEKSNAEFHIFSSQRFLVLGEKYSNIKPSPEAINEIEAVKKDDEKEDYNEKYLNDIENTYRNTSYFKKSVSKYFGYTDQIKHYNLLKNQLEAELKEIDAINYEIKVATTQFFEEISDAIKEIILERIKKMEDIKAEKLVIIKRLKKELHQFKESNS